MISSRIHSTETGRNRLHAVARAIACGLMALVAAPAVAGVTAEEARQLGASLTLFGAIAEGNKEGSIPPYTGGLPVTTNPAGFKKGSGFWADPYPNDKPLFSITAKNVARYAEQLVEGDLEMFKRFPDFRMDIYPSRRSVSYPEPVLANTVKNATRCNTEHAGQAIKGCFGGLPFPIPKTGNEAMWNLLLHYMPATTVLNTSAWYVDASGRKINTSLMSVVMDQPYYYPDGSVESFESNYQGAHTRRIVTMEGPARIVGEAIFSRAFVDPVTHSKDFWIYQPGLRRARFAPENAYDFPVASTGGAAFYDELSIFFGAMDRFEFKLLGKVEKFIPYNNYALENAKPEEAMLDHFIHPDLVRWELHRVWVVEATLKPGYRHAYQRRRFYLDEDDPSAAVTIGWGRNGKIHRMAHATFSQHYDVQAPHTNQFWYQDFSSGVYATYLFPGGRKGTLHETRPRRDSMFTPESLSRISVR